MSPPGRKHLLRNLFNEEDEGEGVVEGNEEEEGKERGSKRWVRGLYSTGRLPPLPSSSRTERSNGEREDESSEEEEEEEERRVRGAWRRRST